MSEAAKEHSWLPLGQGVRVLAAHPCGLLALEKPTGILSHPNSDSPDDLARSLINAPYDHGGEYFHGFENDAAPEQVHLLHRLDSATSGVILVATSQKLADAIRLRFQANDVEKTYFAVCKGNGGPGMHGLWVDLMEKAHGNPGGPVRAMPGKATEARASYSWVRPDSYRFGLCLMKLQPKTGRTHQLRFQCARHHFPIVGDRIYGDFHFNRKVTAATGNKQLYLHAAHIKLKFAFGGEMIRFGAESPLPDIFGDILGNNQAWVKELTRRPTAREIIEKRRARIQDSLRGPHTRKFAKKRPRP